MLKIKKNDSNSDPKKPFVSQKPKVLIVDDDPQSLEGLSYILSEKFETSTAENGPDALSQLEQKEIATIVSDQVMPGISGVELFIEAEKRGFSANRIILTGYSDLKSVIAGVNEGKIYAYLTKPIDANELLLKVDHACKNFFSKTNNEVLLRSIGNALSENNSSKVASQNQGFDKNTLKSKKTQNFNLVVLTGTVFGQISFSSFQESFLTNSYFQESLEILNSHAQDKNGYCVTDQGFLVLFGLNPNSKQIHGMQCLENIIDNSSQILKNLNSRSGSFARLGLGISQGRVQLSMSENSDGKIDIFGQPLTFAVQLQNFIYQYFRNEEIKKLLGDFRYSLAIGQDSLVKNNDNFTSLQIPSDFSIPGFPNEKRVGIIKK